jgi:tryptophanyl-tRNA synthetase
VKKRKSGGLTVALSVQEDNQAEMGVSHSGRIDMDSRAKLVGNIVDSIAELGFSDIKSNPKHGTIEIPGATMGDRSRIRIMLLQIERDLGGLGLMSPCSTYHRFAVGMTGDKMSSSKPESTIFMDDEIESMERKVKRAISGGQPTVEEHRRLGGDVSKDVAFQYLQFFFENDDTALAEVKSEYESGRMLAGEVKQICIDRATDWLIDLKQRRDQMEDSVADFLAPDAI